MAFLFSTVPVTERDSICVENESLPNKNPNCTALPGLNTKPLDEDLKQLEELQSRSNSALSFFDDSNTKVKSNLG